MLLQLFLNETLLCNDWPPNNVGWELQKTCKYVIAWSTCLYCNTFFSCNLSISYIAACCAINCTKTVLKIFHTLQKLGLCCQVFSFHVQAHCKAICWHSSWAEFDNFHGLNWSYLVNTASCAFLKHAACCFNCLSQTHVNKSLYKPSHAQDCYFSAHQELHKRLKCGAVHLWEFYEKEYPSAW